MEVKKYAKSRWMFTLLAMTLGLMVIVTSCTPVSAQDITGLLKSVEGKEIVVTLDDGTILRINVENESQADVQQLVGERVKVKIRIDDGVRHLVELEKFGEDEHLNGIIESMGTDTWVIGGQEFRVDSATVLDEGLAEGVEARVEFTRLSDGTLLAIEIETDEDDDIEDSSDDHDDEDINGTSENNDDDDINGTSENGDDKDDEEDED